MSQFAHRSLTWQQTLCVLLALAAVTFSVMAFGKGSDLDGVRHIGRYGLAITVPLFAVLLVSHFRATRRPDEYPDILSQLVPVEEIFEEGPSHFWFTARQEGQNLRVSVLVQNKRAGPGRFRLKLKHKGTMFTSGARSLPSPLICDVGGAAVVFADTSFPLPQLHAPSSLTFFIEPSFRAKGRSVRFARRGVVTKRVSTGVTLGLLLTGTLYAGGGTTCTVDLAPVGADETAAESDWYDWRAAHVWSPDDPVPVDVVVTRLQVRPTQEAV
jgi:hypothetical protein